MRWTRATVTVTVTLSAALLSLPLIASATTTRSPAAVVPAGDWATYHHDRLRTGAGVIHGAFSTLQPKFTWQDPVPTDTLYASPLVVGHVAFVTTLGNRVYAVSTVTGKTKWSRSLGPSYVPPSTVCGNIRPAMGIVSTPVIDEGRGTLYAVGAIGSGAGSNTLTHKMFALSLRDGHVMWNRVVDPPGQDTHYLLQRVSLALAKGRVVVGFGGNAGDCGDYHGWVESIAETNKGAINRYEVASGPGQGRGAVWMGGAAPTVDAHGNVYVAVGNGNGTASNAVYDHGDAVLKLTSTMKLLDWFAPTTWFSDNAADYDLGSGAPQLLSNGLVLQVGKTHTAYVLHSSNLGHIGGSAATFPVCVGMGQANGGDAIVGSTVVIPCSGGLNAVSVTSSPPGGSVVWTTSVGGRPPIYAAGLVWSVAGAMNSSTLYAFDPATGAVKLHYVVGGELNHFPTPAAGDGLILITTSSGLTAFAPA
jgi:outer membrane protein assembly factor BamB